MKYETISNVSLPKIGFGTWSIGGGSSPNPSLDAKSLNALRSALEVGYTHFDTAESYADGHAEELIGRALQETRTPRENVFITSKVAPEHLHHDAVLRACEQSLRRLNSDYLDLYLIHWPNTRIKLNETFRALNQLVQDGKIKHIGVSNFDVQLLKQAQSQSTTPLITNQVPYSLSDRSYVKNGVLEYCQQNNITLTAYSPVKIGGAKTNKSLRAIAEARNVSPYQIALAWLVAQPRVITIPMSFDRQHIQENFESADIELTDAEITELNRLA